MNRKMEGQENTTVQSWKQKAAKTGLAVKEGIQQFRQRVSKHPVSPLLYVTVATVLAGSLVFGGMIQNAQGAESVTAESLADTPAVASYAAKARIATAAFLPVADAAEPVVEADVPAMARAVADEAPVAQTAYALQVNGETVGYAETEEEIYKLLDEAAQPWLPAGTISYDFVDDIAIVEAEVPADDAVDAAALQTLLGTLRSEKSVYTVQAGDTVLGIASKLNMSVDDLTAMNPDLDVNRIYVGNELVYQQAIPYLSVQAVASKTYSVTEKSPVKYEDNNTIYVGETKTKTQGVDGISVVSANVTYTNGVEVSRDVVATEKVRDVTDTVVYKGTKAKPAPVASVKVTGTKKVAGYSTTPSTTAACSTSNFIWPVHGLLTCYFGGRYGHNGIDIACPNGTPILAADAGTVIHASPSTSYGNLIAVQHDNGIVTYYAHCSAMYVSVGQRVAQGETIGAVGMTGYATGYHLHFEVRINGVRQNPLSYLPG